MDRESAKKLIKEYLESRSVDWDKWNDALETLLAPAPEGEWLKLSEHPLKAEHVGQYAWVYFRYMYEPREAMMPFPIVEAPPGHFSFNGLEAARVVGFKFIGPEPMPPMEKA